ncbi:MAG: hypothetical protein LBS62_13705 [Clostridiales bacterium]|nr:hypothetical protein [Clostridiales bacterium]
MDWDKAKNILIVMLLMLNIFLGILTYLNSPRYSVAAEQEKAILDVLAQNNIEWNAVLPKRFEPLANILLTVHREDADALAAVFFKEAETVSRVDTDERAVLIQGAASLIVENGGFRYDNLNGMAGTAGQGAEACGRIMGDLTQLSGFVPDETETGTRVAVYRQMYKDRLIYTNYVVFTMSDEGIVSVNCQYNQPAGFSAKHEIIPPDEAAFILMNKLKNMYGGAPVAIDEMDLVFLRRDDPAEEMETERATPYYRFYVRELTNGPLQPPFFVNSYTGAVE